jgi:hypothetical protein
VNTYTVNRKHCLPLSYHSASPCVRKAMREASHVEVATFTDKAEALQHAEALHVATGLFHGVAVYKNGCLHGGAMAEVNKPNRIRRERKAARMSGGEG